MGIASRHLPKCLSSAGEVRSNPMYAVTTASCHRRDISDRAGELVAPHRPGGPGKIGHPAQDNRRFTNAVFWTLHTGVTGHDLPSDYGDGGAGGRELYRLCHLVEDGFERFKEWRSAAMRYAKKRHRIWRFAKYGRYPSGPR